MNWGGRYFGYSINTFNPLKFYKLSVLPKIYPVFLLTSFIGVVALNLSFFFKYSFLESLKKSFLFSFFYTLLLISLPEHYFWITGANIYFLPVIISGFLLFIFGKFRETGSTLFFYLSFLFIFILMGSNEIMALLLEGLLILFYIKKKTRVCYFSNYCNIVFFSQFFSTRKFQKITRI